MADKKKVAKAVAPKPVKVTAIVMKEVALSPRQTGVVNALTPKEMIKTKTGRGGKKVSYIEGGYVINKLNEAFSPLGWEFEVIEHGTTERKNEKSAEGEIWVKGRLTIIDHKQGFRVSKQQFGQHPIHEKVPIGDAYKAAGTDALKKCASLLGIGLDVYWGTLDTNEDTGKEPSKDELFNRAKAMVTNVRDMSALFAYKERLENEDEGKLTKEQKKEMIALVEKRLNTLDLESEKQA